MTEHSFSKSFPRVRKFSRLMTISVNQAQQNESVQGILEREMKRAHMPYILIQTYLMSQLSHFMPVMAPGPMVRGQI